MHTPVCSILRKCIIDDDENENDDDDDESKVGGWFTYHVEDFPSKLNQKS